MDEPVAIYRRRIGASLERIWENVLDWEHLPWLHAGSFVEIESIEHGSWGWRARIGMPPHDAPQPSLIELLIERPDNRYVARTVEGAGAGSEIWTSLSPAAEHETDIEVSFHVPGVPAEHRAAIGSVYTTLYTRLWDEDESMMQRREAELAREKPERRSVLELGSESSLRERLPVDVELDGRPFRVVDDEGELRVHSTTCPHLLGPLEACATEGRQLECPWHGYRFDLGTGRSSDGRGLRLPRAPRVEIATDTGEVCLRWSEGG